MYDGAVSLLRTQRPTSLGRLPSGVLNPMVQNTGGWKIDDSARTYQGIRDGDVDSLLRRGEDDDLRVNPAKFNA